jgi:chemotaxis-related protein WspB
MLVLLFSMGDDRYALRAAEVFEITPVLRVKKIPSAPNYVAGLCNFRGKPIPVLDLCALAQGVACQLLLSTRMIVVNYMLDNGSVKPLGLLAEHATETAFIHEADLQQPGVQAQNAPYLGKVAISSGELVQMVEVDELLTPEVIAMLFREGK